MLPLLFHKNVYAKRRDMIFQELESDRDLLVLFNAPEKIRSFDSYFPYRPDSSFLYLTGYAEAQSALLMWTEKKGKEVKYFTQLFVLPRDPEREQWDGFRYGPEGAKKLCGVDEAFEISKLESKIVEWIASHHAKGRQIRILSNAQAHRENFERLHEILEDHHFGIKYRVIESIGDVRKKIESLRLVKDSNEIKLMREACRKNAETHLEVLRGLKAGLHEYDMQALFEFVSMKKGARHQAYSPICAGGSNATILHYHQNDALLKKGELFLIDAGLEYNFYCTDITRTYPIGGKFSKEQRSIMDVVKEAQQETFAKAKAGNRFSELHRSSSLALISGLISLKLLKKDKPENILAKGTHRRYYPHGTSHWLGLDTHDPCPYLDESSDSVILKPGMVFTVEPGLYFMENDQSVPSSYRGIGVRIEDDILVTNSKAEILTEGCPRYADEIEKEMKKN